MDYIKIRSSNYKKRLLFFSERFLSKIICVVLIVNIFAFGALSQENGSKNDLQRASLKSALSEFYPIENPISVFYTKREFESFWIENHLVSKAEANHYMIIEPEAVIATHLNNILLRYSGELISQDDVQSLLDNLGKSNPQLIQSVVPKLVPLHHLTIILRNLLSERVPINDLKKIF